jgi:predicted ATPase/DNA-binding CsgD family transcriptional regulator
MAAALPAQLTTFIGRRSSIEAAGCRLAEGRLVSLVGPGGCGKTRLAIEVARRTTQAKKGRAFFVDLSGISDPRLVPGAVTRALGLPEVPGQDPLETLTARLSKRDLLLVLDNCEHLVEACTALAGTLLGHCARVQILATSRERLGTRGEAVVAVGGLELAERAGDGDEGWAEQSEAARLFVDRARMARAGFVVGDPGALARICERLDGIPLALELAAARARLMSLGAIDKGLTDCFHLLVAAERAGPGRHKSLLASIEWSCGLLSDDERALLHRLSVFASGFSLAATEAVGADGEAERGDVLGLLTSLVDKSLVQALPGADRFRLHETMRAYATGALEAVGLSGEARDRHLGYFTALAKEMEPKTWTSEFPVALAVLRPDLDNLRTALDWAVESEQFDAGAELLVSAGHFFDLASLTSEALARCKRLLAAELEPSRRAGVLYWSAVYARWEDPVASLGFASELATLARSLGDDGGLARGLGQEAAVQAFAEPDRACRTALEAVRLARQTGQPHVVVWALWSEAFAYCWLGRPGEAFPLAEEALREAERADWPWGESLARGALCMAAKFTGRFELCLAEAKKILALGNELPGWGPCSPGELHSGEAYMYLGDPRAEGAFARAWSEVKDTGLQWHLGTIETCRGHLLVSVGRTDEGYSVLEAGNARVEAYGDARICVNNRAVLAEVALRRGDLALARRHLEAAAGRVPNRTDPEAVPVLRAGARLARAEGEHQRAHALACDGLEAAFSGGHVPWAVDLLELTAVTCADLGRHVEASRLLGAAEAQRGATKYARWAPVRDELAPVVEGLRTALGQERFEQAMSEGQALSQQQAFAYARRGRGSHSRGASGWDSLTPSERRVASLAGQHLSNAEIAEKLFVSPVTVKSHLTRVFAKLGVTSRRQLVVAGNRPGEEH